MRCDKKIDNYEKIKMNIQNFQIIILNIKL